MRKQLNSWQKVVKFWIEYDDCIGISRKEYINVMSKKNVDCRRSDEYRCILERAGYLTRVGVGKYTSKPSLTKFNLYDELTYRQARREAYLPKCKVHPTYQAKWPPRRPGDPRCTCCEVYNKKWGL